MPLNLYNREDHREYLTVGEGLALLTAADGAPRLKTAFVYTYLTGAGEDKIAELMWGARG